LDGLNQLEVTFVGRFKLTKKVKNEQLLKSYTFFMKENNIEAASFLQCELIRRSYSKELDASLIPIVDPSQKEKTLPLINNQIILNHLLGKERYDGNLVHIAFLEIFLINQTQQQIAFNKHISTLQHWSQATTNVGNMEDWLKQFKKLSTNEIPVNSYAKALLNYNLIAADYYYETGKFDQRKKAFQEIVKWYLKANLTQEELLKLAKYLCFQDQFSRAIEVLQIEINKEKVDRELLFYFLQISIYDRDQVPIERYNELVEKASRLYPNSFCELFSKVAMGIQSLKSAEVKKIYCEHCEK
jgi:tetratricopeptide (TPR) repeat protein